MKFFFAFLLSLAFVGSANSAESCDRATTQAAMTECAAQGYQKADAELNRVYKKLTGQMKNDNRAQQKLVTAQRAWIAFRDSECELQSARSEGGSVQVAARNICLEEQTRARTKTLDGYMNCEEGDVSCPGRAR